MVLLPVLLAAVGAVGLAAGTHLQHRAVRLGAMHRDPASPPRPNARIPDGLLQMWRSPLWLLGGAVIVGATALNVVALGLAPISVVQPVGALALVVAAVISAGSSGLRITRGLASGIALTVLAVVAFVLVSAGFTRDAHPADAQVLQLSVALGAGIVSGGLVAVSRAGHLSRVVTAGMMYGAVAAAMHVVAVEGVAILHRNGAGTLGDHGARAIAPGAMWALIALLGAAALVGLWLVQTAYASGPPETVLAGLTVLDPLVAVGVGVLLLGEYAPLPPIALLGLVTSGGAAAAGILLIAHHHPGFAPAPAASTRHDAVGVAPQNRRS